MLSAHTVCAHPAAQRPQPPEPSASRVPASIVKEIKTGYFRKALGSLEPAIAAHGDNADYQYRYSQALLGAGKNHQALRAIKKAISEAPRKAVYYRLMGQVYGALAQKANIFHAMGLAKDVLSSFRTAVKLAPENPKSLVDLAFYYIDAPGIVGGSLSKAKKIQHTLEKFDPLAALKVRAHEAVESHHYDRAMMLLRHAARLDKTPQSAQTLAFLYIHRRRYGKGLGAFLSITQQSPEDARAWYWVGRASILSHSLYSEGIQALKHYVATPERPDTAPSLAFAHLRLGDLYLLTGKSHLACLEYAKAKTSAGARNRRFDLDLGKSLRKLRDSNANDIGAITSRAAFSKKDCH